MRYDRNKEIFTEKDEESFGWDRIGIEDSIELSVADWQPYHNFIITKGRGDHIESTDIIIRRLLDPPVVYISIYILNLTFFFVFFLPFNFDIPFVFFVVFL